MSDNREVAKELRCCVQLRYPCVNPVRYVFLIRKLPVVDPLHAWDVHPRCSNEMHLDDEALLAFDNDEYQVLTIRL